MCKIKSVLSGLDLQPSSCTYINSLAFLSAAPDSNCTAMADAVYLKLTDHSMASIGFVMCDNLSLPRFVPEEEREAKYNRVLSSSILALGKLISVTSDKAREEMEELYLHLLREKKFWKYARHKSPNVSIPCFS